MHGDIRGQIGVDSEQPLSRLSVRLGIEVSHLLKRMHAGVRSTGSRDGNRMIGDGRDRIRKRLLYATFVALSLPADEVRAVVLETESDAQNAS